MNCPNCGKELDKVTMVQSLQVAERTEYIKTEDSENIFEYCEVIDQNTVDSQTEGVECPYCEFRLRVKRTFDGKIEIEGEEIADTS